MRLVANSWKSSPRRDEHYLAVLDFPDGYEVFKRVRRSAIRVALGSTSMQLGLNTAPQIRMYHPTEGPRASSSDLELYDIVRS